MNVSRQRIWLLAVALATGVLSALTVTLVLAAPQRFIPYGVTNLSQTIDLDSYFADIAVSPDGDRVVVVWPETYEDGERAKGSVWLRWASESTGSSWSERVRVFQGSADSCAYWAAVAVSGSTAHVAYVVWSPCSASITKTIYHQTYEMGGTLGPRNEITSSALSSGDIGFTKVDLALDAQGDPHFVYTYYPPTPGTGFIYYLANHGTQELVSEGGDYCHNPAIAWADGYAHVVWKDDTDSESPEIRYRRRSNTAWQSSTLLSNMQAHHPNNPDVAAFGGQVVVTWDQKQEPSVNQYIVAYKRYDSTVGWLSIREVGTDRELTSTVPMHTYTSTTEGEALFEYTPLLRPSVALDGAGKPTVVWHVNRGIGNADYDIMYTQAESVTMSGIAWLTPTVINPSGQSHSASPMVAVAPVISPTLHVVYLQYDATEDNWETYYIGHKSDSSNDTLVFLPIIRRDPTAGGM